MTLSFAVLLSVLLVLPADGRRFEWVRALHGTQASMALVLFSRIVATAGMAAVVALGTEAWANAGPLGLPLLVFGGVMSAAWLWMWFWIRTYVADPKHPLLIVGPTSVVLGSVLSVTLWLVLFTLQALLTAWLEVVTWQVLWLATLVWVILDALWLALLGSRAAGYRHIQSERQQKQVNRICGSLLLVAAVWALVVVFGI